MCTPHRDRRRQGLLALCFAIILLSAPAAALDAAFVIAENGSAYSAAVEVENADIFAFTEPGLLGEEVPLEVEGVRLENASGPAAFEEEGDSKISFPEGNYTVFYSAQLTSNTFTALLPQPCNITLFIPSGFDVRNPLLGMVSPGGEVSSEEGGLRVIWKDKTYAECRFYDSFQEEALMIFGIFWISLAAFLLVPMLAERLKKKKKPPQD